MDIFRRIKIDSIQSEMNREPLGFNEYVSRTTVTIFVKIESIKGNNCFNCIDLEYKGRGYDFTECFRKAVENFLNNRYDSLDRKVYLNGYDVNNKQSRVLIEYSHLPKDMRELFDSIFKDIAQPEEMELLKLR